MRASGYVVALFATAIIACHRQSVVAASSYSEYRAKLPPPVSAEVLHAGGTRYYGAIGPITASNFLGSGPPMYIFDESGRMVDWTRDRYDDPRFQHRWDKADTQTISVAQLDLALKEHK